MQGDLRPQFCVTFLRAAARFSREVGRIEAKHADDNLGAFWDELFENAVACVFTTVAAVEAQANELLADNEKLLASRMGISLPSGKDIGQAYVLKKLDAILVLKGQDSISRKKGALGAQMDTLIRLRNALVHFKPEWFSARKKHETLSDALAATGIEPSRYFPDQGLFPNAWATHSGTKWAVKTCKAALLHVADRLGLEKRKVSVRKVEP